MPAPTPSSVGYDPIDPQWKLQVGPIDMPCDNNDNVDPMDGTDEKILVIEVDRAGTIQQYIPNWRAGAPGDDADNGYGFGNGGIQRVSMKAIPAGMAPAAIAAAAEIVHVDTNFAPFLNGAGAFNNDAGRAVPVNLSNSHIFAAGDFVAFYHTNVSPSAASNWMCLNSICSADANSIPLLTARSIRSYRVYNKHGGVWYDVTTPPRPNPGSSSDTVDQVPTCQLKWGDGSYSGGFRFEPGNYDATVAGDTGVDFSHIVASGSMYAHMQRFDVAGTVDTHSLAAVVYTTGQILAKHYVSNVLVAQTTLTFSTPSAPNIANLDRNGASKLYRADGAMSSTIAVPAGGSIRTVYSAVGSAHVGVPLTRTGKDLNVGWVDSVTGGYASAQRSDDGGSSWKNIWRLRPTTCPDMGYGHSVMQAGFGLASGGGGFPPPPPPPPASVCSGPLSTSAGVQLNNMLDCGVGPQTLSVTTMNKLTETVSFIFGADTILVQPGAGPGSGHGAELFVDNATGTAGWYEINDGAFVQVGVNTNLNGTGAVLDLVQIVPSADGHTTTATVTRGGVTTAIPAATWAAPVTGIYAGINSNDANGGAITLVQMCAAPLTATSVPTPVLGVVAIACDGTVTIPLSGGSPGAAAQLTVLPTGAVYNFTLDGLGNGFFTIPRPANGNYTASAKQTVGASVSAASNTVGWTEAMVTKVATVTLTPNPGAGVAVAAVVFTGCGAITVQPGVTNAAGQSTFTVIGKSGGILGLTFTGNYCSGPFSVNAALTLPTA